MRLLLIFIVLVSCLFMSNSIAFKIKREGQEIYIIDQSCRTVTEISIALSEWTKSIGEKRECPIEKQSPQMELTGKCVYNITNCIPSHVAKYEGVNPQESGPNCWNMSLVFKEILPALRYSTPEEMSFYMNSPLCRMLKKDEKRVSGDIGAIRVINEGNFKEFHGFIYISDKIAYSKNGFHKSSPYSLQSLDNVYSVYDVTEKSQCRANELNSSLDCDIATSFYRCISMKEYLD